MRGIGENNLAIYTKHYEEYIKPLLKQEPSSSSYAYFLSHAHYAWFLGINNIDLDAVKFVEKLCGELYSDYKDDFAELVTSVYQAQHDTGVKTDSAESALSSAEKGGKLEGVYSAMLKVYKVYFENEFRLWASVIYFYLCNKYKIQNKATTPESYVNIGGSEKYHRIKNIKISLTGGSFSRFVEGFDNQLRNCGEGHDRWEILDNKNLLLHKIDSSSGKEKGEIEMTRADLNELIKKCKKTIWILQTGLSIFLENNPDFKRYFRVKRVAKISEIEENAKSFADERDFEMSKFELNQERTKLTFSVCYKEHTPSVGNQLLFGSGEKYDILYVEHKCKFNYQVYDILRSVLLNLDEEKFPEVSIEILNSQGEVTSIVKYNKEEVTSFFESDNKTKYMPQPKEGEMPKSEIKYYSPVRVPYNSLKGLKTNVMTEDDFKKYMREIKSSLPFTLL